MKAHFQLRCREQRLALSDVPSTAQSVDILGAAPPNWANNVGSVRVCTPGLVPPKGGAKLSPRRGL